MQEELRKLLGTKTDVDLAKQFGVPVTDVFYARKTLGIPRYKVSIPRHNFDDNPRMKRLFGFLSDYKIAKKFKVSQATVHRYRTSLGIAAFRPQHGRKKEG